MADRRLVPSDIVTFIDKVFPDINRDGPDQSHNLRLGTEQRGDLLALLSLLERIPEELLTAPDALPEILANAEVIRAAVREAESLDSHPGGRKTSFLFRPAGRNGGWSPVLIIRRKLAACPDESVADESLSKLAFLEDPALRDVLAADISAVEQATTNGEWKSATVLGGSVVEALLFWAIQTKPSSARDAAVEQALKCGKLRKNPGPDPEKWYLSDYITVAEDLQLIGAEATALARLLQEFRNLIHPGRAARTGHRCDHGTAHAASAAITFVIGDLQSHCNEARHGNPPT